MAAKRKAEVVDHNYIEEYYQAIMEGSVTVGEWIRKWYTLLIDGLQRQDFYFSQKKANMAIRFIQGFCRHHEGALAPGLIRLELWQKAMISVIFGIVDENGTRWFREIFIVEGRKNGKTLLAAAITALIMFLDPDYGKRAYFVAPKLDQARLCYDAFFQMISKEPEMAAETKKRRTDIYIESTNSSAAPLAFNAKKSDGLNPSIGICDEGGAWQGDPGLKQYEVLKSALGARKQPLLVMITTAGYVDDGIYDELMKRSTAVINQSSRERRLAPFLYMIDHEEQWNNITELRKANPNLGVSISVDYMLEEIAVAENSLSKRVEFLTKYCNVKQNSSLAWLTRATIKKSFNLGHTAEELAEMYQGPEHIWQRKMLTEGKIDENGNHFTLEDFRRHYALGGIDLSQTTDLTACSLLIQRGGIVYYFVKFFLPAEKLKDAIARDGIPYDRYIEKGWLQLSGENFVDYNDCFVWFNDMILKYRIYVQQIGIDRYCAQYIQAQLEAKGFHCDTVFQGTNLTGVINRTEGMLKDGTLQSADGNELMKIHWLDAALKLKPERNLRQLVKIRNAAHVDGVAATLDAMCMRGNVWEQYKGRLENTSRDADLIGG